MGSIEKGKKLYFAMAIILVAISVGTSLFSTASQGFVELIQGIFRTAVEVLILYYIFKGNKVAKIIMIALLFIGILVASMLLLFSMNITFITLIGVYAISIYIIALSPSVKEYLKSVKN
ncbi:MULTISPECIES: hypothetical protein [unclassified Clostridium]|uniref:hypothetical protein n=1 Tax=unclassified Clostridium TaxID=2614128 RepID=UPI000297ED7A|nr:MULTISPECIES: hypothetical protein [unclassified Clostridium]EKQ56633.1 MAG: hypothetical protein A370_01708 [Clostridium sp. Maddingley MBC34-26]